jgi:hypothetical protein
MLSLGLRRLPPRSSCCDFGRSTSFNLTIQFQACAVSRSSIAPTGWGVSPTIVADLRLTLAGPAVQTFVAPHRDTDHGPLALCQLRLRSCKIGQRRVRCVCCFQDHRCVLVGMCVGRCRHRGIRASRAFRLCVCGLRYRDSERRSPASASAAHGSLFDQLGRPAQAS